jgi:hypothetical protein
VALDAYFQILCYTTFGFMGIELIPIKGIVREVAAVLVPSFGKDILAASEQ